MNGSLAESLRWILDITLTWLCKDSEKDMDAEEDEKWEQVLNNYKDESGRQDRR